MEVYSAVKKLTFLKKLFYLVNSITSAEIFFGVSEFLYIHLSMFCYNLKAPIIDFK